MSESTSRPPAFGSRRRELGIVAALVGTAVALRVVHVLALRASPYFEAPQMDAAYHVEWARAVAAGEPFQAGPFFRAPLYVWFLAACRWVFGPGLLAPRLVQALLGGATTGLVYLVGRRATDHRVGLVAAAMAATYWVLVYFDGELLIPALVVPLDLAALVLTLGLVDRPRVGSALGCGLVWGLSAIARPNVLLFAPLLAPWLLWRARPAWRPALAPAAALLAGLALPILPITARNRLVGEDWVLISSQAGVNLWIGNNPDSDGVTAVVPGTRAGWWEGYHDAIALAEGEAGRPLRPSEVSGHYAARAWGWMGAHPGEALAHLFQKLRLFWTHAEPGNNQEVFFFAHHFDPLLFATPLRFDLLVGLAALGGVLALGRGSRTFPLWGFVGVYTASVVVFFVCSRFRVPVLPVLMVLGAQGLVWLWDRRVAGDWRRLGAGGALVAGALASTHLSPVDFDPPAATGHLQLGIAAAVAGEGARAIEHFEAALDRDPDNLRALMELALSRAEAGELEPALRLLDQAHGVRLDQERRSGRRHPGGADLDGARVHVLLQAGRDREAEVLNQAILSASPRQPRALAYSGILRARRGELEPAIARLEEALTLDPSLALAYPVLIGLLEGAGREAEARRWREEYRAAQLLPVFR